jgi:hypothetical protein
MPATRHGFSRRHSTPFDVSRLGDNYTLLLSNRMEGVSSFDILWCPNEQLSG